MRRESGNQSGELLLLVAFVGLGLALTLPQIAVRLQPSAVQWVGLAAGTVLMACLLFALCLNFVNIYENVHEILFKPLHRAARRGNLVKVRKLLERGADVNQRAAIHETPLREAARMGHTDAVILLLSNGADAVAADDLGDTPLTLAEENGHAEVAELLREAGA